MGGLKKQNEMHRRNLWAPILKGKPEIGNLRFCESSHTITNAGTKIVCLWRKNSDDRRKNRSDEGARSLS